MKPTTSRCIGMAARISCMLLLEVRERIASAENLAGPHAQKLAAASQSPWKPASRSRSSSLRRCGAWSDAWARAPPSHRLRWRRTRWVGTDPGGARHARCRSGRTDARLRLGCGVQSRHRDRALTLHASAVRAALAHPVKHHRQTTHALHRAVRAWSDRFPDVARLTASRPRPRRTLSRIVQGDFPTSTALPRSPSRNTAAFRS